MHKPTGLLGKLTRAFWLQIALITVAAIAGVYLAKIVIEEILIKSAIQSEVEYFQEQYEVDPGFSLPDTSNMTGYFDPDKLPPVVQNQLPANPGFYEFDDLTNRLILYVTSISEQPFYLVYYRGQVDALILYYGIFPLLAVLTILYLTLWLVYRFSRRSISPISRLANRIYRVDLTSDDLTQISESTDFAGSDEIQVLSAAISNLGERVNAFVARERNFTRDASHEFRTPLTVIKMATDMMLFEENCSEPSRRNLIKIRRAVSDLENLTEVFLMLAREHANSLTLREVDVNQLIRDQIEQTAFMADGKNVEVRLEEKGQLRVVTSETVIAVLLGNLIRNALLYTHEGEIRIRIDDQRLTISDSGQGIPESRIDEIFKPFHRATNENASGFGIGLTIVKRLCDHFSWDIQVDSSTNRGTTFTLGFNH